MNDPSTAPNRQTPRITPDMLDLLSWTAGTGWVLRDERLVARWCN